ncbi:DUF1707 domain-containing protein [Streptomyces sp. NPDC090052]|uniref:DUF1707 SHOCT-like domain-containing protein n=1 Tax=unclassified Streptomyces TaxID=2593676 RepID=UPI002255EC1E|nr:MULTISPECIES: DUF1707 domain-containing protein [unclassified Streptomyces]MCX4724095.1 DUF1707 domain-containing protein [Streptomyces sp. NBC_01306]WSV06361.1 DUF1707 domain-containing protein [Streptomyces sp. NBC_01020]WSX44489.1 DUF1707 domain-containing protein [Streptomyces sp. NBC_00963]WSX67507.1 DUF1707 domain-containing protein [Streptomyces sp. NBC_00932]
MDLEKHPQQPQPVGIRASDADRDRIADILRDALAEGRLDADEHSERIESVYRAKTLAELEPLVQDLPAATTGSRPDPGAAAYAVADDPDTPVTADNLVAVFSSSTRKGRWRVGRRTNAFSLFGSVEIDLTEALFEQRLTVINATAIFGNIEVKVPENVTLRGSGTGIFGNFEVSTLESENPEAPVVVVNGCAVFSNIEAKPKRGKLVADLRSMVDKKLRKHLG